VFVGDHESPEVVGESPFQAAHGVVAGLALCDLGVEVAAADAVRHADLGNGDEMDRRVQLPITSARQAVTGPVAAGDLDRRDTGLGGESMRCREPRRSSGATDQSHRSDGTDTIHLA